ncbi:MAG: hypothetical protein AB7G76_06285 [Steroidobacteraceae bacterium]
MAFKYLAKLVAKLELQSAQYQAELEKANKKLARFERDSKKSFNSIDASAKKLAQGLKGVGAVLGAGGAVALGMKAFGTLSHAADSAIANLAKTNADFAASLERTKAAQTNLWQAGTKAAEAQERLNAALKDPAIVGAAQRAADGVASGLITMKVRALEALAAMQRLDRWMGERIGIYDKADTLRQDYAGLVASKMPDATAAQKQKDEAGGPNPYMKLVNDAFAREAKEAADAAQRAMDAAAKDADVFAKTMASQMNDAYSEIGAGAQEEMNRIKTYFIDPYVESIGRMADRAKEGMDKMSVYADQAARNMQDAFANFLFDPFEGGVKGMLKSFIDAIRRMMAEKAAAAIFDSVSNGGLGLGGMISGLFGFANGGSFKVGGTGGTDSQVVAFRATPGERVSVATPGAVSGAGGGGGAITIQQHFDNRGATVEAIQLLPSVAKQASDDAVSRILKMRRQGRL